MFSKQRYKGNKGFQYKLKCQNGRCTAVLEPTAISVNRHMQSAHNYTCCLRITRDDPLWNIAPEVCADLNTFEQKGMFRCPDEECFCMNNGLDYDYDAQWEFPTFIISKKLLRDHLVHGHQWDETRVNELVKDGHSHTAESKQNIRESVFCF
jgi:hypothetical protein